MRGFHDQLRWRPSSLFILLGCSSFSSDIHLDHPDKSAVAKHSINLGHRIQLHTTTILSIKSRYMDQMIKEATETANNKNREDGLHLSQSWKPSSTPSNDIGSLQYNSACPDLVTRPTHCPLALMMKAASTS
jgi:hypothetical protein